MSSNPWTWWRHLLTSCLVVLLLPSGTWLPLLAAAKPHRGGYYGYYDPYPPAANDQVLYEFSPLEDRANGDDEPRSRETRDLSWREDVDAFLSGAKEPSCEQLREMWRVAREIQQRRAVRTNEVPQRAADANFVRFSAPDGGQEEVVTQRADRRRMSVPPHARSSNVNDDDGVVYGVVRTHEPVRPNGLHVRDPAKEIYGLLRDRTASPKSSSQNVYGNVREEEGDQPKSGYFDKLREKLLQESQSSNAPDTNKNRSHFGVVHYSQPATEAPPSSLDKVREMIAASEDASSPSTDGRSSFDRIRDRLMNTRLTSGRRTAASRLRAGSSRALYRSRESARQHRRRSIREIVDDARRRVAAAAAVKAEAEAAARRRAIASAAWLQQQQQQQQQQYLQRQRQLDLQRRQRKKARKERQRQRNRRNRRRRKKKLRQLQLEEEAAANDEGDADEMEEEEVRRKGRRRKQRRKSEDDEEEK